ncbi:hypothetical protein HK102_005868, partial [Quaeritorhiza haematococci]
DWEGVEFEDEGVTGSRFRNLKRSGSGTSNVKALPYKKNRPKRGGVKGRGRSRSRQNSENAVRTGSKVRGKGRNNKGAQPGTGCEDLKSVVGTGMPDSKGGGSVPRGTVEKRRIMRFVEMKIWEEVMRRRCEEGEGECEGEKDGGYEGMEGKEWIEVQQDSKCHDSRMIALRDVPWEAQSEDDILEMIMAGVGSHAHVRNNSNITTNTNTNKNANALSPFETQHIDENVLRMDMDASGEEEGVSTRMGGYGVGSVENEVEWTLVGSSSDVVSGIDMEQFEDAIGSDCAGLFAGDDSAFGDDIEEFLAQL